jgi:hypothetical protein
MFIGMTSTSAPDPTAGPTSAPASGLLTALAKNRTAIVALVIAIVGFLFTEIPIFGVFAGGPEDLVALVLGIVAIVLAFKRKTGLVKAIIATVLALAALGGISLGEGTLW